MTTRRMRSEGKSSRSGRIVPVLSGAIVWSACCGALAALALMQGERQIEAEESRLIAVFAGGAALAWLVTAALAPQLKARLGGRRSLLFLIIASLLALSTIGVTAALFALDYRSFYARWHAEPLSRIWLLQLGFTSASAVYQFLVIGLRLYLPFGPLLLCAAAAMLLRLTR
ncbi:hypothetical protein [Rhizobium sp. SSA_523]|uniref:hypothetical protein n=1 Tax=Rhizobium sp. SSA_523 TaxID=2952477 RepID=UPI00209026C4|nr:hypothetical protein [Rhizobium sp. SSA_523]MCO5729958.1 hypothetical protein [Rhizobium sp. SSA_523]WKC25037.1 hypothetical protein QTJ18_13630 [Rhizobium sp. SSA_523]